MIMNQGKWISTKERLPQMGQSVIVTHPYRGSRQYWVMEDASTFIRNGKLFFGSSECDYWQPIELIKN